MNKNLRFIILLILSFTITLGCKKNKLPKVETDTVSNISSNSATTGGNVSSKGGSGIIDRGVCWNTTGAPTIENNHTLDGVGEGEFISEVSGLSLGETYYVRAYATNDHGTSYGKERSFTTEKSIGDKVEGGIVFYLFKAGDPGYVEGETHGLVVSEADQGSYTWSPNFTLVGTTEDFLGSGPSNTSEIVAALGPGTYAASFCSNLTLNGYNDWYLPSKAELNLLYINREVLENLASSNSYYQTSTEKNSENMWVQNLQNGEQTFIGAGSKTISYEVRAIRTF